MKKQAWVEHLPECTTIRVIEEDGVFTWSATRHQPVATVDLYVPGIGRVEGQTGNFDEAREAAEAAVALLGEHT